MVSLEFLWKMVMPFEFLLHIGITLNFTFELFQILVISEEQIPQPQLWKLVDSMCFILCYITKTDIQYYSIDELIRDWSVCRIIDLKQWWNRSQWWGMSVQEHKFSLTTGNTFPFLTLYSPNGDLHANATQRWLPHSSISHQFCRHSDDTTVQQFPLHNPRSWKNLV